MNLKQKMEGVLYGQALGDAMGMPGELWGKKRIMRQIGKITDFLNGPEDNAVAYNYKAGQFTDDTAQSLVLLDSLKETNYIPDSKNIGKKLLLWAEENNAFERNILGPSSKAALKLLKKGADVSTVTDIALSNGAAMRIAPIGCLFRTNELERLAKYVRDVSKATHSSDITIAGATIIASAVAIAIECGDAKQAVKEAIRIEEYALSLGAETFSPSIRKRVEYGINIIDNISNEEEIFSFIYDIIGCGVATAESVSSALLLAYYTQDINKCALNCANIGGDTDTIGAMATAICGAALGVDSINPHYIKTLNDNNPIQLKPYVDILEKGRELLHG
ncbi:MAG: ADP-ribosylglycohydrolase family protein [Brevinema sp.]